jgi:ATP-dependent DNA ligase
MLDSADAAVYPNRMSAFSNRRRVQGSIPLQPCIPRRAHSPPNGDGWVHEIKHDGFRILARREGDRIRLFTRNGYDFAVRFPKIALAVAASPVRSCVVDGERSSSIGRGRPAKGALALAFDERIQKDLANVL